MSIYYFIGLLSTVFGLYGLVICWFQFRLKLTTGNRKIGLELAVLLFIAIFLAVWGIDMLIHLEQF